MSRRSIIFPRRQAWASSSPLCRSALPRTWSPISFAVNWPINEHWPVEIQHYYFLNSSILCSRMKTGSQPSAEMPKWRTCGAWPASLVTAHRLLSWLWTFWTDSWRWWGYVYTYSNRHRLKLLFCCVMQFWLQHLVISCLCAWFPNKADCFKTTLFSNCPPTDPTQAPILC